MCLILLPLLSLAQDKKPHYNLVGPTYMMSFNTGSTIWGPGFSYKYKSYKALSFVPGVHLSRIEYSNIDGGISDLLMSDFNGGANLQLLNFHLRLTGHAYVQLIDGNEWDKNLGISGGAGVALWRIEANIDVGRKIYFGTAYLDVQAGLSYVFSQKHKYYPPLHW